MKMNAKLRAYLRYNPIDLRGTDQYVVYSFVLTILAVIFGIAWCNEFLCFLRLPLKTVLPYSVYCSVEYWFAYNPLMIHIVFGCVALYIGSVIFLSFCHVIKMRFVTLILSISFFLLNFGFCCTSWLPSMEEVQKLSHCELELADVFSEAVKKGKANSNTEKRFVFQEDSPFKHPGDVRHRLWSDGTITVYKPWENNQENNRE